MKKNAGIKILTGVVASIVVLVFVNTGMGKKSEPSKAPQDLNNLNAAIASQFNDNIRDVSARLIETEKKMHAIEAQNKALKDSQALQLSQPKEGGSGIFQETQTQVLASLESLKKEMETLKSGHAVTSTARYPVAGESSLSATRGVNDVDARLAKKSLSEEEKGYWERFNKRRHGLQKTVQKHGSIKKSNKKKDIPYYTIPAGADLANTTLMSALIGEVPVEGKLMQPLFPFTAIIGRGGLMASNGVPLPPDVSGMKVNGYAIGVGSFLDDISCVRAYVTSVLFTFQDGHFVVVGKEEMKGTADLVNNESLGYLTTQYGNPCIHGKYFTNAPRVLGAMLAAGGVQGVGAAVSQWQMTNYASDAGVVSVPTGSFVASAAGNAVSNGSVKAADWLEKRIQGSFDMVFVPASSPFVMNSKTQYRANQVSLHLTQTIALDKQPSGRVIDYGRLQNYPHDFSLR